MNYCYRLIAFMVLLLASCAFAEPKVVAERNAVADAKPEFTFDKIRAPSADDAAAKAEVTIVAGARDPNSGGPKKVNDDDLPSNGDQPKENFFFNAGTPTGRLLMDLKKVIAIKEINTYSWHTKTRGAQVYKLYVSDGTAKNFDLRPKSGLDPTKVGWTLLADVDTRPKDGVLSGQHAVSVTDSEGGPVAKARYLLFEMWVTEADDNFGHTFYSEIDVIADEK